MITEVKLFRQRDVWLCYWVEEEMNEITFWYRTHKWSWLSGLIIRLSKSSFEKRAESLLWKKSSSKLAIVLGSISGVRPYYMSTLCLTRRVQELLSSRNSNFRGNPSQPLLLLYSREEIACCGALSVRDSRKVCWWSPANTRESLSVTGLGEPANPKSSSCVRIFLFAKLISLTTFTLSNIAIKLTAWSMLT